MEEKAKKRSISPTVDSFIPSSVPATTATHLPTTSSSGTGYLVLRHLLTNLSTCGVVRKVLLECALRGFNIEYFYVDQYTFIYEVTNFNPSSYCSSIRVSCELKRGGSALKAVCNVPCIFTMRARQMIEVIICESQHI